MIFAEEIGVVDLTDIDLLVNSVEWKKPEGRDYYIAALTPDMHPLLKGCRRAFMCKIDPGGLLHPHTDDAASEAFDTDLIVVANNKQCRTYWQVENNTHSKRLELGMRYRMVDRGVEHWAVNNGRSVRIDLVIEYPK